MAPKLTIEEMQKIAVSRGGLCLSEKYINNRTKLRWQCKEGHLWHANPSNIKLGRWCPICASKDRGKKRMLTIEEMQKIANSKGGVFLSKKYLGAHIKHLWKCGKGHTWKQVPSAISYGSWCPFCAGRGRTIIDMRRIARNRGGKCLSDKFKTVDTKLKWQCSYGHVWEAIPMSVENGHWCPICRNIKIKALMQKRKPKVDDIQELARKRGGKLISTNYINAHAPLRWECKEGHTWDASFHQIKGMKSWCPICSTGISERICREFFEKIFNVSFPRKRPPWLVNSRGKRMELDGYSDELKLAFEYQGQQHYYKNTFFHRNETAFTLRKKDDHYKKQLCKKRGIVLVDISYEIPYHKMQAYIGKACRSVGIKVPQVDMLDFTSFDAHSPERLAVYKKIAESWGGKLISTKYFNAHTKLKWACRLGHIWEATPHHIKLGTWCPKCSNVNNGISKRLTISELENIAEKKGGKCLSKLYEPRTKLKWQCSKGHIWEATPYQIKELNCWCPTCGKIQTMEKRKKGFFLRQRAQMFSELQKLAKLRGGKIISKKYTTSHEKLQWQCSKGHIWSAKPHNIKINHTWCPICARKKHGK